MVKVVRKAVGMTPVEDSIKGVIAQAAARRLVGHAPADATVMTALHTAIKSRLLPETVAETAAMADQTGLPTETGSHSAVMEVTGNRSIGMVVTAQLTVTGSHLLAGTAAIAEIGPHTVIVNHSRVIAVRATGTVDQIASHSIGTVTVQRMVIGNHSIAKVAETGQIVSHSIGTEIVQRMVIGTPNRASHLTAMADHAMAGTANHSVEMAVIGLPTAIENHLAGTVTNGRAMVTGIGTAATNHANQENPLTATIAGMMIAQSAGLSPAVTAATTGPADHAKATAPVSTVVTGMKALTSVQKENHLLAETTGMNAAKVAQTVHSNGSHLLPETVAKTAVSGMMTVMIAPASIAGMKVVNQERNARNGSNSTGGMPNHATRMVRLVHARPVSASRLLPETAASAMTTGIATINQLNAARAVTKKRRTTI